MNKPILIGINGNIGSGKSTAVKYLTKYHFIEYAFATPLKDIAVILGFNKDEVFGNQEQKLAINEFWGISGREFLQKFGTDICRNYLPIALPNMKLNSTSIWVCLFEKFYQENSMRNIAVSDVRFEDESKKIKKLDGYIIRIDRGSDINHVGNDVDNVDTDDNIVNDVVACDVIDSITDNNTDNNDIDTEVMDDVLDPIDAVSTLTDEFKMLTHGTHNLTTATYGTHNNTASSHDYRMHKSELQTDKIFPNIVIHNNGSIEELYRKIDRALYLINSNMINHNCVAYL